MRSSLGALLLAILFVTPAWSQAPQPAPKNPGQEKPGSENPAPGKPAQDTPMPAPTDSQPKQPIPTPEAPKEKNESDPKAIEVVQRYLEVIGGLENLSAIKDYSMRYVKNKYEAASVTPLRAARFLKTGYRVREEWELPGMGLVPEGESLTFLQVYNGEKGYVKSMGYVSQLEGRTLNIFVWDKYLDDFFCHWEQDGYTLKYRGEETVSGVKAHWIEVRNYTGSNRQHYYFNAETGDMVMKRWRSVGPTGNVQKEEFYEDYTKVRFSDDPEKWIRVSMKTMTYEETELSLETEVSEVKVNSGLSDAIFERPDGPDYEELVEKKRKERLEKETGEKGDDEDTDAPPSSTPASGPTSAPASAPKQ